MAQGFLKIVSEDSLQESEADEVRAAEEDREAALNAEVTSELAHYVRTRYWEFRRHRTSRAITRRMLDAQMAYNGQYSAQKLQEIQKFGGSDVYARLTAIKCRGATAVLRDVYLTGGRPWAISPTPAPEVPDDIKAQIDTLLSSEVQYLMQNGQEPDPKAVEERRRQLAQAADDAARKEARERSKVATRYMEDRLVEGGFYKALHEFLIDLPVFPFAVIKGPVFMNERTLTWEDGCPSMVEEAKMFWRRVSPFDIFWTPGASSIEEADVIERIKLRRSDLQALIGLPGYDDEAIKQALSDYTNGLYDNLDDMDSERAWLEDKESPSLNRSGLIDSLEFQGEVPGAYLKTWNNGKALSEVEKFDEAFDYNVMAWVVGRHCIKAKIAPNPRLRHNYFATSFEKVSGAFVGRGLPEILEDSQHVANAAFRSLVNNMGMASGPQVAINEDRMSPTMNVDSMYPWKRWRFQSDPMGSSEKPIDFFQPNSNASELMGVFEKMMMLSDEVSGIPRYMTGNQNVTGAAATASGLSQLMNNASKVMQQVASQVDTEIIDPILQSLYEMVLLTDEEGLSWGDLAIRAQGVTMAQSRDADRQRQLEFLQLTANPVDQGLVGPRGRAIILRELADNLGLDGESIVPSEEELRQQEMQARNQQQMQAQQEQAAAAQGSQAPKPGPSDNRPNRGLDNAQRTRSPQAIANQAMP